MILRPAVDSDRDLTFAWANDPLTRAMSFSTAPIAAEDHARWFAKALTGVVRRLFIAEYEQEPFGILRIDFLDPEHRAAEVGINLAPSARGRGLALPALAALSRVARELGVEKLVARIKPENTASIRSFEKAGYRPTSSAAEEASLCYELSLGAPSA